MTPEQAAIEYAKSKYGKGSQSFYNLNHKYFTSCVHDFLVGHARAQNRWVKVTDGLPEEGVKVLTLSEGGYMDVMAYDSKTEYHSNFYSERISHWQSLPQQPEHG